MPSLIQIVKRKVGICNVSTNVYTSVFSTLDDYFSMDLGDTLPPTYTQAPTLPSFEDTDLQRADSEVETYLDHVSESDYSSDFSEGKYESEIRTPLCF